MAQQVQNGVQRYAELTQELLGLRERTDEVLGEMRDLGDQLGLFNNLDSNQGDNRSSKRSAETTSNKRTGNNASTSNNSSNNNAGEEKRGRGRPKGSGKKKSEDDGQGGPTDLPSLLAQIASEENGLKLADFVTRARERGYKSKAGDFSNMVYQALMKMVHRGDLVRDDERNYRSAA